MTLVLPDLNVRLDEVEVSYSEYIANMRLADVERHRRKNVADLAIGDSERANHMLGALGEHAFAKWLGTKRSMDGRWGLCPSCKCFAGTVNTFKRGGDVGRYQVRTRSFDTAPLIVREDDRDDDVFVLVIPKVVSVGPKLEPGSAIYALTLSQTLDRFLVVGWCMGEAAKMHRLKQDPRGRGVAYFVPQGELQPMMTLPTDDIDSARTEGADAHERSEAGNTDIGTDSGSRPGATEPVRRERTSAAPAEGEESQGR